MELFESKKRLTNEEIMELLKKAKDDLESRNNLIIFNQRLIYTRINKRFKNIPIDENDLFMIGVCGLIKAVDSFKFEMNCQFSTYASACIDNEILNYIQNSTKSVKSDSYEKKISQNAEGDELALKDILIDYDADVEESYYNKQLYQKVNKVISELKPMDQTIIKMRFGFDERDCASFADIGRKYNVSRQYLNARYQVIMRSLALKLKDDVCDSYKKEKTMKKKGLY